jgi:hypothetical protein
MGDPTTVSRSVACRGTQVRKFATEAFTWLHWWLARRCPRATMSRSTDSLPAMFTPVTKKVAGALCARSVARICGVYCDDGPSSKVR